MNQMTTKYASETTLILYFDMKRSEYKTRDKTIKSIEVTYKSYYSTQYYCDRFSKNKGDLISGVMT